MRTQLSSVVRSSAVLFLLAGCGFTDAPPELLERTDSAGIEIVRLNRAPADTVNSGAPAVRIGSTGLGGAEHELFEWVSDLVPLPGGHLAVVDNRGGRIAVFDTTGVWRYDIGGLGDGPGEYRAPIHASTRGDTLFVYDALQRRLSRYTADGVFLGSIVLAQRGSALPFAAVDGGYILEVEWGQLMDPEPAAGALVRVGRDGEEGDTLVGPYPVPKTGWRITDEATGMGHMVNPPALAVYPPWTVAGDRLHWLDPDRAAIEVVRLADGVVERVIGLPHTPASPTASDRDAFFRGLQTEYEMPDEAIERERANTAFAELRPAAAGVLVDDEGRLWVAEHDPAAFMRKYIGAGWDLIDLTRERTTHVRFPEGFRLMAVRGAVAYGITTLENGVHVVDVHRLSGVDA